MRALKLLAVLCLLPLTTGCLVVAAAVAAGAIVTYSNGEGRKTYAATVEKARTACAEVLEGDLKIKVLNANADAASGKIVARTADDRKIEITLRREGEKSTEVRFRVGFQGDEGLTREFYKKLDVKLE